MIFKYSLGNGILKLILVHYESKILHMVTIMSLASTGTELRSSTNFMHVTMSQSSSHRFCPQLALADFNNLTEY